MELKLKLISALDKIMPSETEPATAEFNQGTTLKNEYFAFQLAYNTGSKLLRDLKLEINSELSDSIQSYQVDLAPAKLLAFNLDENVISKSAGMFPDILVEEKSTFHSRPYQWSSIWFKIKIKDTQAAGKYDIRLTLKHEAKEIEKSTTFTLQVLNAVLPEQTIERTEWFHADCIALLHKVEVWSEDFWQLLEKYFIDQVDHGCTRILTPLFTPPLDTDINLERTTVQLIDIQEFDNKYTFNFDKLKRWIELAKKCGYKKFEFSHLFSQWGAKFTPKIIVNNEKKFGWHTLANSVEYRELLIAMFKELIPFIDSENLRDKCVFHVSDEPQKENLEDYKYAAMLLKSLTDGIAISDALSDLEFVKEKLCDLPVPGINELEHFAKAGVTPLWTYYCCGPDVTYTNRFMHFPGARTAVLGFQLFQHDVVGFLHWGYNFWLSRLSKMVINPYQSTDAGGEFPAGDAFLVYPGLSGPVSSIRHELLLSAFQDHRRATLLATKYGKDYAKNFINSYANGNFSVTHYPTSSEVLESMRYAMNLLCE